MSIPDDESRQRLEGDLTSSRIAELKVNPVAGNFDLRHLREVHRRIFQDLPSAGFPEYTPGEYRTPVPPGVDWQKCRVLDAAPGQFFVAYSKMDEAAQRRLETTLAQVEPDLLGQLNPQEFAHTISKLYSELDYIHPFPDGNSRTLRSFTAELAEKAGYRIDWERFDTTHQGRDKLYIARDLAVNKIAKPGIEQPNTMMRIVGTIDRLKGNRDLGDLLADVVRPSRSVAFDTMDREHALSKYPELKGAYAALEASTRYIESKEVDQDTTKSLLSTISAKLIERMDRGEVVQYDGREIKPADMTKTIPAQNPENDKGMDR
ncbi:Fic/DOC family protein [Massilia sp. PWRC2]|uniref:Fic/DOC family protein n=1 Tax=Massilia sp. PWRC2 TaxID=2804626 RepID=UPI003CED79B6